MSKVIQKGMGYNFNSDQIVMFTDAKKVKNFQGYFDIPSMSSFYQADPDKAHLGMQSFFLNQKMIPTSIFPELYAQKKVLEVDGFDGEFTYSIPIPQKKGCYTNRDYSWQIKPGIDEGKFKIALNRQYNHGDILTNDVYRGQQLFVTDDDVEVDGDTFIHTVTLNDTDARRYFDAKNLISGVQYWRVDQRIAGEYGTNFGNIDVIDGPGEMKLRFKLGGPRGIESAYTAYADKRGLVGAAASTKNYMEDLYAEAERYGELMMVVDSKLMPNGGRAKPTGIAAIGSTVEFLVMRELEKVTASALMFSKAGKIKTANGEVIINEGLWHQLRRGKLIRYSRPGGITVSQIKEAVEYVFRGNYALPTEDREITFKCGKQAYDNVLEIFSEEVSRQIANTSFLQQSAGGNMLPKSLVSSQDGTLQSLKLDYVRFTSVMLPGIGRVNIEHDINMDHGYGMVDRLSSGFHKDGHADTTYSMIIWDAADQQYSNNKKVPEGASIIEGGSEGSNVYLVKPKGAMTYWGRENGRYDSYKAGDIVSSHKQLAQSFWAYNACSVWVKDISRTVIIELSDSARTNFA